MKLATLRDGTPDGRLVVVSRDCRSASIVPHARTLQAALDFWNESLAELEALSERLNEGRVSKTFDFDPRQCLSPLPRAYQWADGSAYPSHLARIRAAQGRKLPNDFETDPLMYQGGSDAFLAPHDAIPLADDAWGCDLEAEIAVITAEVPLGADRETAGAAIRLVMLGNDVSLRELMPTEVAKGFGFFQSKPASSFSPCAVTPDELGDAWRDHRVHGVMEVSVNEWTLGRLETGRDLRFGFADLVAHAARTRRLGTGTIVGGGTISNRGDGNGPASDGGRGYGCLAEMRAVEQLLHGAPRTPWLKAGDRVRIHMQDAEGRSIFGSIEQQVARP